MQKLISEVQENKRGKGKCSNWPVAMDSLPKPIWIRMTFTGPPNLEIVQITSPKYVSMASIENAIKPYMESQGIRDNVCSLAGNPEGKRFFMQFVQNAFTCAKLAKQVTFNFKTKEGCSEIYADTAKPDKE